MKIEDYEGFEEIDRGAENAALLLAVQNTVIIGLVALVVYYLFFCF